jgi:hypothetical protein
MANTYTKIATNTVSSAVASITFSSIPSTYTDLIVKASCRSDRAATDDNISFVFNGNIAANYSMKRIYGSGSTVSSSSSLANANYADARSIPAASNTASTFGNADFYIPNYTSSNYKSVSIDAVSENNATAAEMGLNAGLWSQTAAITSITFYPTYGANFVQYSTFTLYGISNA